PLRSSAPTSSSGRTWRSRAAEGRSEARRDRLLRVARAPARPGTLENRLTSNDVQGKDSACGKRAGGHTPRAPAVPWATLEVIDEAVGHDRTCADHRARWDDRLLARPACARHERDAGRDEAGSAAPSEADPGGVPRAGPGRPGQGARAT